MRVRTESKRSEIVAHAAEVFRDMGFERTSMAEIASRIGGSKATLYGYFESKESLFIAVANAEADAYFDPMWVELNSTHVDTRTALRRLGEKAMLFVLQPHVIAGRRMLIAIAPQSDITKNFYKNGPAKGLKLIAAYLQTLTATGVLRAADPAVMAQHLIALLESELVPEYLYGAETGMPKLTKVKDGVKRAVDVFLAAYKTQPAG